MFWKFIGLIEVIVAFVLWYGVEGAFLAPFAKVLALIMGLLGLQSIIRG